MVDRYIAPKETIILNVVQASEDGANCASIQMSSVCDPERKRTLLVMTKIDNTGDNLFKKFESYHNKLKKSCHFPNGAVFLVRNRTQKENEGSDNQNVKNDDIIDISSIRESEKQFFKENEENLSGIPESQKGIFRLREMLYARLVEKIGDVLPKLARAILDEKIRLDKDEKTFRALPKNLGECQVSLTTKFPLFLRPICTVRMCKLKSVFFCVCIY